MSDEPETDDCGFLGGRLRLRQFRKGHRVGTDAVLLAAAADLKPGEHLIDAGAGVGAAALAVLARVVDSTAVLLERDAPTAELASFNVESNGFGSRARVLQADLFDKQACKDLQAEGADVILCNPPFFEADRVRVSQDPRRRAAHVLERPLGDWWRRLAAWLRPGGRLVSIIRPEALPAVLTVSTGAVGGLAIRAVHPRADAAAIRLLISGTAGSRAPFGMRPPLILHDATGCFLPVIQGLHDGKALPS